MVLFYVFKMILIVCYVSAVSACRANVMEIRVTKNEVDPLKNELIITSKEVAVLIRVDATIPAHSHDSVTIDALTCWDDRWKHLVISNHNFYLHTKDSIANNTVYRFLSTQKLITPKATSGSEAWQWLCELTTHWDGCKCNVVHNFPVKVSIYNQNETNDSTRERIPLHEYRGPAELKQLTCEKEIKDMDRPKSALHEEIGVNSRRIDSQQANPANNLESTEKTFSNRNCTEPQSRGRDRKRKAYRGRPTEKKDGLDIGVEVEPTNSYKDVKNSSNQVVCGEAITSTTWVIFSVASVLIFLVGLVFGVFCRRPRAREPEQEPKQTDEQTDENIYDEVDAKGINNRPPLPAPDQAVYIYNSPYDHTLRYQKRLV